MSSTSNSQRWHAIITSLNEICQSMRQLTALVQQVRFDNVEVPMSSTLGITRLASPGLATPTNPNLEHRTGGLSDPCHNAADSLPSPTIVASVFRRMHTTSSSMTKD